MPKAASAHKIGAVAQLGRDAESIERLPSIERALDGLEIDQAGWAKTMGP